MLMFISLCVMYEVLDEIFTVPNNKYEVQMNYEDFCHIATLCTEQIGPKCRKFFSACNFLKFEKDDFGRIAILPFYLYVMRTVSF
jgi:serine/threonine-protein phosphatase 2A regulatory subunit B''